MGESQGVDRVAVVLVLLRKRIPVHKYVRYSSRGQPLKKTGAQGGSRSLRLEGTLELVGGASYMKEWKGVREEGSGGQGRESAQRLLTGTQVTLHSNPVTGGDGLHAVGLALVPEDVNLAGPDEGIAQAGEVGGQNGAEPPGRDAGEESLPIARMVGQSIQSGPGIENI